MRSNGEYYGTYELLGKYWMKKGNNSEARKYFDLALTKNVASEATVKEIKALRAATKKN